MRPPLPIVVVEMAIGAAHGGIGLAGAASLPPPPPYPCRLCRPCRPRRLCRRAHNGKSSSDICSIDLAIFAAAAVGAAVGHRRRSIDEGFRQRGQQLGVAATHRRQRPREGGETLLIPHERRRLVLPSSTISPSSSLLPIRARTEVAHEQPHSQGAQERRRWRWRRPASDATSVSPSDDGVTAAAAPPPPPAPTPTDRLEELRRHRRAPRRPSGARGINDARVTAHIVWTSCVVSPLIRARRRPPRPCSSSSFRVAEAVQNRLELFDSGAHEGGAALGGDGRDGADHRNEQRRLQSARSPETTPPAAFMNACVACQGSRSSGRRQRQHHRLMRGDSPDQLGEVGRFEQVDLVLRRFGDEPEQPPRRREGLIGAADAADEEDDDEDGRVYGAAQAA